MANHQIETQWMGDMQFNALVNGHTIVMDAPEKVGGHNQGSIPKPLILTALSGCTGMDIIALLRKEKIEMKDFVIKVTGELSKQAPIEYISMHMEYQFIGNPAYASKALEAVTLSQEKFCGVSHMLKKALPITWQVVYNATCLFNNQVVQNLQVASVN